MRRVVASASSISSSSSFVLLLSLSMKLIIIIRFPQSPMLWIPYLSPPVVYHLISDRSDRFSKMIFLKVLCSVLFFSTVAKSYDILAIFPHMGLSHWAFFRPFVLELVNRGHNVTLLSYFGIEELKERQNYDEFLFERDEVLTNTFAIEVVIAYEI